MASEANQPKRRKLPPAKTPEARENQLIALAMDIAEQKMLDGTASNNMICHYLKLGSTRERLEKEKLANEVKNLEARTESIESFKRIEALYVDAINAMRRYSGQGSLGDETDEL